MANSVRELAEAGVIEGKKVKHWIDLPYGAFAAKVRATVDPLYGLDSEDDAKPIEFSVKVRYSYIPEPKKEYASKTYTVTAMSEDDATEAVRDMFDDDSDLEAGEDHEISEISNPIPLTKESENV